jgi:group II intron reverse transcriptase/maturase
MAADDTKGLLPVAAGRLKRLLACTGSALVQPAYVGEPAPDAGPPGRARQRQPKGRRTAFPPWESAFSINALRRAWQMVRANQGRAGTDGETVAAFERRLEANLQSLQRELREGTYRPRRVTQVLVPKPRDDWRPLTIWAVRDRVVQRAVHDYLEPVLEPRFLPCSYGFRPGRSTRDVADTIVRARQAGTPWVLDADIKDCFGQMQDRFLMRQLARWQVPTPMRDLISRWLEAEVWNAWQGAPARAGTSQGGVISPLLCNIYLHPFDERMRQRGWWLVRYADDFIVLARSERAAHKAQEHAAAYLDQLGLDIHPQKTRITHFDKGFQFVGWFFVRDELFELK